MSEDSEKLSSYEHAEKRLDEVKSERKAQRQSDIFHISGVLLFLLLLAVFVVATS